MTKTISLNDHITNLKLNRFGNVRYYFRPIRWTGLSWEWMFISISILFPLNTPENSHGNWHCSHNLKFHSNCDPTAWHLCLKTWNLSITRNYCSCYLESILELTWLTIVVVGSLSETVILASCFFSLHSYFTKIKHTGFAKQFFK